MGPVPRGEGEAGPGGGWGFLTCCPKGSSLWALDASPPPPTEAVGFPHGPHTPKSWKLAGGEGGQNPFFMCKAIDRLTVNKQVYSVY